MTKFFLYARKSTDEPDRQILSIEAQIAELKEFATKEQLNIVHSLNRKPPKSRDDQFSMICSRK
jgi:DNA invertase Pin-like site-specific DNA recombinase